MAEDLLIGDELKKMVKVAAKQPLAFAFNPGKGEDEPFFSMHRTKSPEVLGRTAKAEGAGTKVAVGTCMVADRIMSMTCLTELPGLAKRVKRFLKSQNVQLNVRILDAKGTVLEEDIELLPDDPEAEGAGAGSPDAAEVAVPPDRSELTARARGAGPRIAAAPPQIAERLAPALRQAVEHIKADALAPAAGLLDQIEAVLSRLPPAGETAKTAPTAPPPPTPQDTAALVARIKAAQALLPGLPPAIIGTISAALAAAVGALKSNDAAKADELLTRVETALRSVAERAGETAAPDPRTEKLQAAADELSRGIAKLGAGDAAAALLQRMASINEAIAGGTVEAAVSQIKQVQESLRLLAEVERLTPRVSQALSSGAVADANALSIAWNTALELVTGDDPGQAAALLGRVEAMLAAGAEAGLTRQDAVPDDVQPFAKARLEWGKARQTLDSELSRLKDAIREACAGNEDLDEVAESVDDLDNYLDAIDARLENKLDLIVNSDPGTGREALKREALAIIGEYQAELDTPFFKDVDNNGFAPVSVASTARASLAEISRVLAG